MTEVRPFARVRRHRLGLAAILIGVIGCGEAELPVEPIEGPGDYTRSFESRGRLRRYEVHVPPGYGPTHPAPLVLVFHGVPRGAGMRVLTGFDAVADAEGFIVIYPYAAETRDWAVGCDDCTWAERNGVDDLGFVRDLIAKMAGDAAVDLSRVYAMGFSQGALFVQRLACDLSAEIAAFSSVAATMLESVARRCAPLRPVPFLSIMGTEDPQFPWEGQQGAFSDALSADATVGKFVELNGCASEPEVSFLPDLADDGTTVRLDEYHSCAEGSEVSFYIVEGGGHTWPNAPVEFSPEAGSMTRDLDANDVIAAFFARHAL